MKIDGDPIILGITMGDPAGIGPEIIIKAFNENITGELNIRPVVIGDITVLRKNLEFINTQIKLNSIETVDQYKEGFLNVLDMKQINISDFCIGTINAECGKASYEYIIKAINLALDGKIHGIVTCPINKKSLHNAGINYPGHTEILAEKTSAPDYSMLFVQENVAVVHVTTHCSIRNALDLITTGRVLSNIHLLNNFLIDTGSITPKIAVSGLNPHAGEDGLFGSEEQEIIMPAVRQAQETGISASGPFPPDTVFMRAFNGEFGGIVSMLHDHGFVALKSRDFSAGVNITTGLPIIRTSVGHGTAFPIAGKGLASEASLLEATKYAVKLAKNKIDK